MALTRSRGLVGQVRGVSHHGPETHLHLKAGYIDADFLSSINFSLAFRRRTIHWTNYPLPPGCGLELCTDRPSFESTCPKVSAAAVSFDAKSPMCSPTRVGTEPVSRNEFVCWELNRRYRGIAHVV